MSQHTKGSSHHLMNWTKKSRFEIAEDLESILKSVSVEVSPDCIWIPDGNSSNIIESTLEDFCSNYCKDFPDFDARSLNDWWVNERMKPTWDFISTCKIKGKDGLILIEAKSHIKEMETAGKSIKFDQNNLTVDQLKQRLIDSLSANELNSNDIGRAIRKLQNHDSIGQAIAEARGALSNWIPQIKIHRDAHYQLSNRIASAWKLAQCGIPTILLYLGFTDDDSWPVEDRIKDDKHWELLMKNYFAQVGAEELLEHKTILIQNKCTASFNLGTMSCLE